MLVAKKKQIIFCSGSGSKKTDGAERAPAQSKWRGTDIIFFSSFITYLSGSKINDPKLEYSFCSGPESEIKTNAERAAARRQWTGDELSLLLHTATVDLYISGPFYKFSHTIRVRFTISIFGYFLFALSIPIWGCFFLRIAFLVKQIYMTKCTASIGIIYYNIVVNEEL
jgi:hypothetical protein